MTQIATDVENVLPLYKISDGKGGGGTMVYSGQS